MHSGGNLFSVKKEFIGISKGALVYWQIPNHVAVKIALELKKLLIDNSLLDVSQSDLEANLFKVKTELLQMENFIVNG
jgi:hypothetical protein